ncbi:MAG: flippase-like domain-containing protein, partial [Phycisphaeraceae bacterium]|nr:flippase-like domain-containing protein [Phycisphaeraceae bacterium]
MTLTWQDQVVTTASGAQEFRPGVLSTLRGADVMMLAVGWLLVGPVFLIQPLRWWLLMRARGLRVTMGRTLPLYLVGTFLNYCMPGMTGGDVVKAYYASRGTDRRADAVMSVLMDRVVGMVGMLALACVAGLFMLDNPLVRQVTAYLWLGAAGLVVGTWVYFWPTWRRMLGVTEERGAAPASAGWLSKVSRLIGTVDRAVLGYRHAKRAALAGVGMSMGVHFLLVCASALGGYALGLGTPLGVLLAVVPVLFMAGAVPLTYQGLGVMEGLGVALLGASETGAAAGVTSGGTANQLVGMLLLIRLYQMSYSLIGSYWLLRGDVRLHEAEQATSIGSM